MRIERIEIEGHRDLPRIDWRPADLTLVEGHAARELAEAVFTLSQPPRGWAELSSFYSGLGIPPRLTPDGAEAHTARWRLSCAPRGAVVDPRRAEYELGIYSAAGPLPWEIRYEFLRRFDDFTETEVLTREGSSGAYKLSTPPRPNAPRRGGRESFAGDISVLGARQELFDDPAVYPFAQPLACWSWYREFATHAAAPARARSVFPAFHERLIEDGGNLANALLHLDDLEATRETFRARLREALPGLEALVFKRDERGDLALELSQGASLRGPHELDDDTLRALCALTAASATAPPPLLWFEPAVFALPATALAPLAAALLELSERAQVVLASPPGALVSAIDVARARSAPPAGWRSERIHAESQRFEEGMGVSAWHPLTGLSTAP